MATWIAIGSRRLAPIWGTAELSREIQLGGEFRLIDSRLSETHGGYQILFLDEASHLVSVTLAADGPRISRSAEEVDWRNPDVVSFDSRWVACSEEEWIRVWSLALISRFSIGLEILHLMR